MARFSGKLEFEFKVWEESCDRAWRNEIPRFELRAIPPYKSAHYSAGQYDLMSVQILEDTSYGGDSNRIYINKKIAHPDEVVQAQIEARWRKYASNIPRSFSLQRKCPYCNETLRRSKQGNEHDIEDMKLGALETCPNCNYWSWHYIQGTYIGRWGLEAYFYTILLGKIREFDDKLPDACAEEIASWLRRKPDNWQSIHPKGLEKLVADVFRANYSTSEVWHVGKPDDGGVDVIYVDADKKQWLIQVKRRAKADATESVATIRNLLGTMLLGGSGHGIVVSTADHFSYRAYDTVKRAGELGMTVKLIDRKAFDRMLDGVLLDRPWFGPLVYAFPEFAERLLRKLPSKSYQQMRLFESLPAS